MRLFVVLKRLALLKKFLINNLSLTLPDDYSKEDFDNINKIFEKKTSKNK